VTSRGHWLRWVLILLGLGLVVTFTSLWALPRLLIASEANPLPASDAVIQFAFDEEPARHVVNLYRRGLAKKIVCASSQFSPGEYVADYMRLQLLNLGIPASDIEVLHLPLTDCFGEMLPELLAFVQRREWKTVLLAVHAEESRAIRRLGPPAFEGVRVRAIVTYSPESRDELINGWWRTHWKAQRVVGAAFGTALDMCYSQCR
jgi:hypothetical protein